MVEILLEIGHKAVHLLLQGLVAAMVLRGEPACLQQQTQLHQVAVRVVEIQLESIAQGVVVGAALDVGTVTGRRIVILAADRVDAGRPVVDAIVDGIVDFLMVFKMRGSLSEHKC